MPVPLHIGLCFWGSAYCESLSHASGVPAPFSKGAFLRPVSFYCAIPGFFRLSIDSVGTKHPKKHRPKRGQGLKPSTRAKAKGQSRMVPPGGFSRGEQFERERVAPPLSRLLCVLSCRGKKVRPRWQALAENRLEKRLKGYNRVSITTSKYYPTANRQFAPRLLPQSPAVTAPSRRELWGLYFATLACCFCGGVDCESLV